MSDQISIRDKIEALLIRMAKASKMYSIYQSDHRLANDICIQVHQLLEEILILQNVVTIGIISHELAFEKKPFIETSAKISDFIDRLSEKGLKKITFCQGILKEEIFSFIHIISDISKHKVSFEETEQMFLKQHIVNIRIGHISLEEEELLLYGVDDVKMLANKSFQRGVRVLERQMQNIKENRPVDVESIRLIAAALTNCLLVNKSLLMMLASFKLNDEEKYIHNLIVCVFTLLQAEILGIDRKYYVDIASAALLHNIGLLSLEREKGKQEIKNMDQSTANRVIWDGVKILLNTEGISPLVPLAALEYPMPYQKSTEGNPIYQKGLNLVSMFITIAKYYDQLRSSETHQVDFGLEKIYEKMTSMSGNEFHPDLLGNFFNVVGLYPPGTLLELDTREICIVIRSSIVNIHRPTVEIIYDGSGKKYKEPLTVNLLVRNRQGRFPRSVAKSLAPNSKYDIPNKYVD